MSDENSTLEIENTVRVATGFAIGGVTAVHFSLGYLTIAMLTIGIILFETVYLGGMRWYEGYKHSKTGE